MTMNALASATYPGKPSPTGSEPFAVRNSWNVPILTTPPPPLPADQAKPIVPATASIARRPRVAPSARRSRVRRENPVVTLARLARRAADDSGRIPVLSRASGSDGGAALDTSSPRTDRRVVGDPRRHPAQEDRQADDDPGDPVGDGRFHGGRVGPVGRDETVERGHDEDGRHHPADADPGRQRAPGDRGGQTHRGHKPEDGRGSAAEGADPAQADLSQRQVTGGEAEPGKQAEPSPEVADRRRIED